MSKKKGGTDRQTDRHTKGHCSFIIIVDCIQGRLVSRLCCIIKNDTFICIKVANKGIRTSVVLNLL